MDEARHYFARVGTELTAHFSRLGSKCTELDATDRLRILHDFFGIGEEADFRFDMQDMMRKGHDFKDYICPDTFEFAKDHFRMGEYYGRVIFLRDYANYIKDSMVAELCDLNRNLLLSLDVIPIPTDEAVREVENRLLGVETNITNWQRRQNRNNNFSAVVPYDMEQQRKESKEFLSDLTTRDQRMMFGLLTMVHVADSKEQLVGTAHYSPQASVPVFHALLSANGRFEYGAAVWVAKGSCFADAHDRKYGCLYPVSSA